MAGLGLLLSVVNAANAMVVTEFIDDWGGFDCCLQPVVAMDRTADNMGNFVLRSGLGGGVNRVRAFANLNAGDGTRTQDGGEWPLRREFGYGINDANSTGHGYWSWTGSLQWVGPILLSYAVDATGFDIIATFLWNGQVARQIHWKDLAATGPLHPWPRLRPQLKDRKSVV